MNRRTRSSNVGSTLLERHIRSSSLRRSRHPFAEVVIPVGAREVGGRLCDGLSKKVENPWREAGMEWRREATPNGGRVMPTGEIGRSRRLTADATNGEAGRLRRFTAGEPAAPCGLRLLEGGHGVDGSP